MSYLLKTKSLKMRKFHHLSLLLGALMCATFVSHSQTCVSENVEYSWVGIDVQQLFVPYTIQGGCSGFDAGNAQSVDIIGSDFYGIRVDIVGLQTGASSAINAFFEVATPAFSFVLYNDVVDSDIVNGIYPSCVCATPECIGLYPFSFGNNIGPTGGVFTINFSDLSNFPLSLLEQGTWTVNLGSVDGTIAFSGLGVDILGAPCQGCTSSAACNFDPAAVQDDGSCEFTSCGGCTYPNACNYNPQALVDDGSCDFDGVTVTMAVVTDNYPTETTWQVLDAAGAIVASGGPYTIQSGLFESSFCLEEGCYTLGVFDSYGDGICCNWGQGSYSLSTDNGTLNVSGGQFQFVDSTYFCIVAPVEGCTTPFACNFVPNATLDNGSCEFETCAGCTYPDACNFSPNATIDDGSCEYASCAPVGSNLDLIQVSNPFLDIPYVQAMATPFLSSYSGWFDEDKVEVTVYNPGGQMFSGAMVKVSGNGIASLLPVPATPESCCSLATVISLPAGLEAKTVETVELIDPSGAVVDGLGEPGVPLGELTFGGIPRSAGQHQLVRAGWTLRGNSNGQYPAVWEVREENEELNFISAWNLNAFIDVAVDATTGNCHLDADNDGICDELELPAECDDVNAPNYSVIAAELFCDDYECIEFWEASCCSTAVTVSSPIPGAPGSPAMLANQSVAGPCGQRASEMAFCNYGQRAFVVDEDNQLVRILGYGDLENPSPTIGGVTMEIIPPSLEFVPTDVGIWNSVIPDSSICCSTMVAVAWMDTTVLADSGYVGLYDTDGVLLDAVSGWVATGPDPRGLSFSEDGKWLVVASGGEGQWDATDPEGSITCIDVSSFTIDDSGGDMSGITSYEVSLSSVSTITGLDARMDYGGVSGATTAQMLEPSDVSITPDSKRALINCQVNNAVIEVDLDLVEAGTGGVLGVYGLGTRDMTSGAGFDGKNDGVALLESPSVSFLGWRQPDHLEIIEAGAKTLMFTANEGAPRLDALGNEYVSSLNTTGAAGDYNGLQIDPAYGIGLSADPSDDIYVFGSRSFSIWDITTAGAAPTLVYDSNSEIEAAMATQLPDYANSTEASNGTADFASRARGPEPQGVAFGHLKEIPHLAVTLEQMGGAVIFKLVNLGSPSVSAVFQAYASHRNFADETGTTCEIGDLGAEGILWLSKDITGNTVVSGVNEGFDAILVANDESGTITTYSLESALEIPGCMDSCACNYNDNATVDDDSCDFTSCVTLGCTYATADNFDPAATEDNGTCTFTDDCPADINDSGSVDTGDLLDFLAAFGTVCP